jgi:endonuclease-3
MPLPRADGSVPSRADRGKARAILNRLRRRYPDIGTALDYQSPFQLLVVTVLSAQTTDENVNKVAPILFERYPTVSDLAEADPEEVEAIVYSTGFYRQKTKSIITLAQAIEEKFAGEVPMSIEELVQLPGVGRKTASVLLAEAWGVPAIAVDTHVKRVSRRLGLTAQADPVKIEQDLKALFPEGAWSGVSMRFIQFGRDICDARRPLCRECELFGLCEFPERFVFAGRRPRK